MSCIVIYGLNNPYQNIMLKCTWRRRIRNIRTSTSITRKVTNNVTKVTDELLRLALTFRFLVYRRGQSSIFAFPVIILFETIPTWVPYGRKTLFDSSFVDAE